MPDPDRALDDADRIIVLTGALREILADHMGVSAGADEGAFQFVLSGLAARLARQALAVTKVLDDEDLDPSVAERMAEQAELVAVARVAAGEAPPSGWRHG